MTTLADWTAAFRAIDGTCPWPGPRPLDRSHPNDDLLLIRRADDEEQFSDDVLSHQLVVLSADTGVGKTSLLEIGLTRRLESAGFVPLLARSWTKFDEGDDAERFVVRNLRSALPPGIAAGGLPLCEQLDRRYGERAVLVLDQFEELIRYRPALFHDVLRWLAGINKRHETHVVLSLRAEYVHRLRWLESQVRPFSMATYILEPLTGKEAIDDVVRSGNRSAPGAITEAAASEVSAAWLESTHEVVGVESVGLLHLQAALYALHARAGGPLEPEHVAAMLHQAADLGIAFHELAALEAVRLKLERCADACRDASLPEALDPVLVEGTLGMVQRLSGQLSSGGYKLVREEWELASKTLAREIDRLGVGLDLSEVEALYRRLAGVDGERSLLTVAAGRDDGSAGSTPVSPPLARAGIAPAPWKADPDDLSSGPMFGMAPVAILLEELRRFTFALHWLRTATIVRSSAPTAGQTMLALVHDGFGRALDAWADEHRAGPASAINLLTAAHGERFVWQTDRRPEPLHAELDGLHEPVTITNVRWRDCLVSASFRGVAFVNCDFRGTRFERCAFQGVVFVNCLLDGATFGECTIYGGVADDAAVPSALPDFRVDLPLAQVGVIARYRGLPTPEESWLYSRTSGVPAVPWKPELGSCVPWKRQAGGLTMYGGRLSSLMVRDCDFEDGGTLALRYIAGSSLDMVEQRGGTLDVYDSAVRGLTVTRRVEEVVPDREVPLEPPRLDILVRASVMADTWFGPDLLGRARFNDCLLLNLLNLSDRSEFDVELAGCGFVGMTNVHPPDESSAPRAEFQLSEISDRASVVGLALRMDYRSTPARLELDPPSGQPGSQ